MTPTPEQHGEVSVPMNRIERLIDLAQRLGIEPVEDGCALAVVCRQEDSPMYALDDIVLAMAERMGL